MEHYITLSEVGLLLAMLWLPVFAVAAVLQWRLLAARGKRVAWLLAALLLECGLAFVIWLSPLHRYFLHLDILDNLAIGSIPLQAAVLAALSVTFLVWASGRHASRPAP